MERKGEAEGKDNEKDSVCIYDFRQSLKLICCYLLVIVQALSIDWLYKIPIAIQELKIFSVLPSILNLLERKVKHLKKLSGWDFDDTIMQCDLDNGVESWVIPDPKKAGLCGKIAIHRSGH